MDLITLDGIIIEEVKNDAIVLYKDIGSAKHNGQEIRLSIYMNGGFMFTFPDERRFACSPEYVLGALIKKLEE